MIYKDYSISDEIFLGFKHIPGSDEIQITRGIMDPKHFFTDQTVLISTNNFQGLRDLIYDLAKLPLPVKPSKIEENMNQTTLEPPEIEKLSAPESIEEPSVPVKAVSALEEQLKTMTSKQIVDKVRADTGQTITNSLKSKAAILAKALRIYNGKSPI
jgi:hypothetical protein